MANRFDTTPASVCILRLSAIGDTCHVLPIVRTLQRAWPDTRFTWIIGKVEAKLFGHIPDIEFIVLDKKSLLGSYRLLREQMRGRRFDVLMHMQVALRASLFSSLVPAKIKLGFDRRRARELQWLFTIFVNPLQFGPNEDFAAYPRTPDEDRRVLESLNVALLFAPEVADIYPRGQESTARVHVPVVEDILCGAFRPGHFMGVATVVTKLLNIVQPDVAVFGEKDYQQLLIIRRAAVDLCMPVEIIGAPTTREPDGLAMSSRNRYLSAEERAVAPAIYAELERARKAIEAGSNDYAALAGRGAEALRQAGFRPDYFEIRDAATLEEPGAQSRELVVLTAARIGRARLIDNVRARRAAPAPS